VDPAAGHRGGTAIPMDKRENYADLCSDGGDGEEVEILEVVGVDEAPGSPKPAAAPLHGQGPDEQDADEYLLDFDAPAGELAEAVDGEAEHQRLVRLRADYDNLRKRTERERQEFERHANFSLVGALLPVIDNLERALAADTGDEPQPLREGLVMIHRQLLEQLRAEGLTPIDTIGQGFDPNLHDAVATDPTSAEPANTIVEEMQKGYLFRGRVLRPAMVTVSTGATGSEDES
jgi:molecular chaperone GrpE